MLHVFREYSDEEIREKAKAFETSDPDQVEVICDQERYEIQRQRLGGSGVRKRRGGGDGDKKDQGVFKTPTTPPPQPPTSTHGDTSCNSADQVGITFLFIRYARISDIFYRHLQGEVHINSSIKMVQKDPEKCFTYRKVEGHSMFAIMPSRNAVFYKSCFKIS